ncbi:MAG: hypothetical protein IPG81_00825 [Sandaracinaceae bacterium]|nr:hypothetical protein [Sandaracinaceae bacterium]
MGLRARLVEGFLKHRTRLARLVAVVGILVIAAQFLPVVPREVELRYDLGPAHASVRGLELVYQAGDEDLASARFGFGEEGPRLVEHRVELAPGHYDVRATLDTPQGNLRFIRHFEAPADGVVRIELFDLALAGSKPAGRGVSEVPCHSPPLNPTECQTSLPWHPHLAVLVWRSVPFSAEGAVLPP